MLRRSFDGGVVPVIDQRPEVRHWGHVSRSAAETPWIRNIGLPGIEIAPLPLSLISGHHRDRARDRLENLGWVQVAPCGFRRDPRVVTRS